MTKEELLLPRVEVINYYPYSRYKVGDVLNYYTSLRIYCDSEENRMPESEANKSSSIFKQLAWHERRDEKDMPKYLKYNFGPKVIKASKYFKGEHPIYVGIRDCVEFTTVPDGLPERDMVECYTPATQEEYETYINSLKTI